MLKKVLFVGSLLMGSFVAVLFAPTIVSAKTIKMTVKANSKTHLGNIFIYGRSTCYSGPLPRITKKTAKHGQVITEKSTFRPKSGPCKGNIIKGYKVFYKTKPGFRGVDTGVLKYKFAPRDDNKFQFVTWRGVITVE